MSLIYAFAGICMCCAALSALLPDTSLKKTVLLAMGLMMMAMWAECLRDMLVLPWNAERPSSILESSGLGELEAREESSRQMLQEAMEP